MNKKELKKVAIIGAGITGLYLAWKLSEKGYKVVVFEKKSGIGEKSCSALVSNRIKDFIPWNDSFANNEIRFCKINFSKKIVNLEFKPAHLIINRERIMQYLFELAKKNNVEFLFNRSIETIPDNFYRVIGCDGALSKTRKNLGLNDPSFRLGIRFLVDKKEDSNQVEVWSNKKGFFWKIPRDNQLEYGGIGSMKDFRKDFNVFCNKREISFNESELKGALVPQGLIFPKNDNITLCGDACGLTKPWSGGGIILQFLSTNILVKEFPNFNNYHKKVKKTFNNTINRGKILTKTAYFLGNKLPFLLPSKILIDNDFLRIK